MTRDTMNSPPRRVSLTARHRTTVPLGDLVVAAYDEAAHYSRDPGELSTVALVILRRLHGTRRRRGRSL